LHVYADTAATLLFALGARAWLVRCTERTRRKMRGRGDRATIGECCGNGKG
jgi:hypothetical protein